MSRQIRVSVELNIGGHRIPPAYYDLPENWDEMSAKEQDELLASYAEEELAAHASSGASVVDKNAEDAS